MTKLARIIRKTKFFSRHINPANMFCNDCLFLNKVDTLKSTIMKKKEEQLQISLDRVKLQKHVYELCRVQKLTINEVRKKNRPWDGYYLPLSSYL